MPCMGSRWPRATSDQGTLVSCFLNLCNISLFEEHVLLWLGFSLQFHFEVVFFTFFYWRMQALHIKFVDMILGQMFSL